MQDNLKTTYDSNNLELPTIIKPIQRTKGQPYMITSLSIKITKHLDITADTPLLQGIIPGTKTIILQPIINEDSSAVTIPSVNIETDPKKPIEISDDDSDVRKIKNTALSFAKKPQS